MARSEQEQRHQSSYRKGVVLGLTFAEMLLLLLFCLILAFGYSIQKRQELEAELAQSNYTDKEVRALKAQLAMLQAEQDLSDEQLASDAGALAAIRENNPELYEQILNVVSESDDPLTEPIIIPQNEYQRLVSQSQKYDKINASGLAERLADLSPEQLEALKEGENVKPNDWPPIITLSDKDNFRFETGSAVMSESFQRDLHDVALPELLQIIEDYNVDVVEIYGHTDEQPVDNQRSNLDRKLIDYLSTPSGDARELSVSDNAGLGFARAASVAQEMEQYPELKNVKIIPYSAGQLVLPDGEISKGSAGDAPQRRRIEIRVRRE